MDGRLGYDSHYWRDMHAILLKRRCDTRNAIICIGGHVLGYVCDEKVAGVDRVV